MPKPPYDKCLHFIYGAIIFCVGYLGTFAWFPWPLEASMALVALFAVGKELVDRWSNLQAIKRGVIPTHGVEVMDTVATILGGAVTALPLFISTIP